MTLAQKQALALAAARQRMAASPAGGKGDRLPVAAAPAKSSSWQDAIPKYEPLSLRSLAHGAGDMASFGTSDEIAAWLKSTFGGTSYDASLAEMRQKLSDAQTADPTAFGIGQFAGGAPMAVATGATGPLGLAAGGGVMGGLYGFGSGEGGPESRLTNAGINALTGAATGALVPAVGKAAGKVFGGKAASTAVKDIAAAKTAAYQKVDALGVRYSPTAFDGMVSDIGAEMRKANLNPMRHPKAASMLADLEAMRGHSPSLTELDQLRQVIRRDLTGDDAERFFAKKLIDGIDNFVETAKPGDVVGGNPLEGAAAIKAARNLNTRYRKLEAFNDAVDEAQRNAAKSGSGGNVDNTNRQAANKLLKTVPNLTPEEEKAARRIVFGTKAQNTARRIGKLAPGTGGLNSMLAVISAGLEPRLIPPFAIAAGAKAVADSATARNVRALQQALEGSYFRPPVTPRALQIENVVTRGLAAPSKILPSILLNSPKRPALAR